MVTTYGSFPGVQVETTGGGITAVSIGEEEKLVIFGAANYQNDTDFSAGDGNEDPLVATLDGSTETAEQINARREADTHFGAGSELADAMREALANDANIEFLYGVAPKRFNVVAEAQGTQTGTLNNGPIWEEDVSDESNIQALTVADTGGTNPTVEYTYESPPTAPSAADTVAVNPLTAEFAADLAPAGTYEFSYKYLDWSGAFNSNSIVNVIEEDETGIFAALSDADSVSVDLNNVVGATDGSGLRENYKLVNALSGAEPNDNEVITSDGAALASDHTNYTRRDARFDTATYAQGSVDEDHYFKFAPVRQEDSSSTILGGIGGLFAGNPLTNPIYNDQLDGYENLEQSFTKSDADNMRGENVIPVREAGSIRVKDNLSTSTSTDWERDFWRRRIADRVILIAKTVGDTIIGQINDEQTQQAAARLIRAEIRELVDDRLLQPNEAGTQRWFVDVYEDSANVNEVNIDIGFTPYGIVKRIDTTITINT